MDLSELEALIGCADRGEEAVLAIVLTARGSTPRKAGAALVANREGLVAGTVGGGALEARILAEASRLVETGGSLLARIDLSGADARAEGPICGGEAEVLVFRVEDASPFRLAASEIGRGEGLRFVFRRERGPALAALLGASGEALWGFLDSSAAEGLAFDSLFPPERLLVLGGGHVGKALAGLALGLGFRVTVADPRPEYSERAAFDKGVETLKLPFEEAVESFAPRPSDYAVVVSPGHQGDISALRALLAFEPKYIGFIGSRRKTGMVLDLLRSEGFEAERVSRLCAPIGLDIGAETPEEIALAIAAELVAYRRDGPCLSYLQDERLRRRERPYS
jgi:xanthine dehydrogenase accessory factor